MPDEPKTPLKQQAALLALVLVLGAGGYWLLGRKNPYATPETTFATAMDAVARNDADDAWDCVEPGDRRKVAFIGKRMLSLGADADPLEELFRQGLERYPDFREAALERVQMNPTDPKRAKVWIVFGRWQVQLEMVKQGDAWLFDKVSEVILGGLQRRRPPSPEGE